MTAEVKDELQSARGQLGQRPPSRGGRSVAVCRGLHIVSGGWLWRPRSTSGSSPDGCVRTFTISTVTAPSCMCCRPVASGRAPGYLVRVAKDGRRWRGRPACWI